MPPPWKCLHHITSAATTNIDDGEKTSQETTLLPVGQMGSTIISGLICAYWQKKENLMAWGVKGLSNLYPMMCQNNQSIAQAVISLSV